MQDQLSAIRHFNRFYTRFIGLLDDTLLDSPVTLTEGRILFEINRSNHCNAAALIDILGLDRGYISRILAKLVRLGLVEKKIDPADKRVRNLSLTSDGRLMLRMINKRADAHIGGILKAMNRSDRLRLVEAMMDIQKILTDLENTGSLPGR